MIEQIAPPSIAVDSSGRIVYITGNIGDYFDAGIGLELGEVTTNESATKLRNVVERMLNYHTDFTFHLVLKDIFCKVDFHYIPPSEDTPELVLIAITPVHEYKIQTMEIQDFYRSVFEETQVGIAQVTMNGRIVRVNPYLCKMLGYEKEELLRMSYADLTWHEDFRQELDTVRKILRNETDEFSVTKRYIHKKGHAIWAELSIVAVYDESGEQEYMIAIIKDISQKIENDKKLATAYDIINQSPAVAFVWLSKDGWAVEYVSENVKEILGYAAEDFISGNLKFEDILHPDDLPRVHSEVERQIGIRDLARIKHDPYRIYTADGEIKWMDDRTTIVRDQFGNATHFQGVLLDITDRKIAEQELEFQAVLLNHIQDWVTATDMEGHITYVNKRVCQTFGMSREELIGRHVEFYGENTRYGASQHEILRNTQKYGEWRGVVSNFTPAGREIMLDTRTRMIRDKNGKSFAMIGISTDVTELKKTEDILRDSRDRYQSLVSNLPGVVYRCLLDKEWTMIYISKQIEKLTGYSSEEVAGNRLISFAKMIHPEDRRRVFEEVMSAVRGNRIWNIEYRVVHQDGSVKWVFEKGRAIRGSETPILYLDGFIQDISERRQAEADREQYLAQLQYINDRAFAAGQTDNSSEICRLLAEAIHEVNPDSYVIITSNDKSSQMLSINATAGFEEVEDKIDDLIGQKLIELQFDLQIYELNSSKYATGKLEKIELPLNQLIAGYFDDNKAAEFEELLNPGDIYHIGFLIDNRQSGGATIFMKPGAKIKYESAINTLANHFAAILERKQATEALRESEEKYRVLFYSFPLGINVTDSNGNIIEANRLAEKLLGLPVEEQTERTIDSGQWKIIRLDGTIMPAEEYASVRALKEGRVIKDVRMGIEKPTGEVTWISVTAAPLPIAGYGVVITYIDITETLKAYEELQKFSKLESLGIVAGGIAHNFKNILTSISLSVELAKKRPERAPEMLMKVEKSIDKAAALANRFQTFYRGDEPVKNFIDINEVVDEAVNMGLSGSNITYIKNFDNDINTVSADAKQINEVILNMVINARQAMPNGGRLRVSTRNISIGDDQLEALPEGAYVQITVEDSGSGIPKELQEKIQSPVWGWFGQH
ncbi:MAG: PAS domain-containing sensor histidine kinase, partial [Bacteroidota bacterium]